MIVVVKFSDIFPIPRNMVKMGKHANHCKKLIQEIFHVKNAILVHTRTDVLCIIKCCILGVFNVKIANTSFKNQKTENLL